MNLKRLIGVFLCSVMMLCLLPGCAKVSDSVSDEKMVTIRNTSDSVSDEKMATIRNTSDGVSDEKMAMIRNTAEERKQSILNSPATIVKADKYVMGESYSGTAYYVSNNGNDRNNGRSPEKAFATLEPFRKIELQYGDAVFFERGSIWRAVELPWSILGTQGITLSAYGEGAKPAFYGSEENGTGTEKWELYYSDESGKKIWKFYREITEVATIVLNEEEVVYRDVAYWNGDKYLQMDDAHQQLTGEDYDVTKFLSDGWCFPALQYPDMNTENLGDRIFRSWDEQGEAVFYKGPLYFRCDAGNPGELYSDIEFIEPFAFCDGMSDYQTYDNLCIKYSSMTFCSGFNGIKEACNGVVQNCEVGWMGGHVFSYATGAEEGDTRIQLNAGLFGRNSGAMTFAGSNYTIKNNYVHDSFQEGIALETFDGCETMSNNIVSGNLIERTTQGILLSNWDTEVNENHIFKDILVEDNIVLDSGINNFFSTDWENEYCNAMVLQGGPCAEENLIIRNNIFAVATGALVHISEYSEKYCHIFEGNTYAQIAAETHYIPFNGIGIGDDPYMLLTEESVKTYLGDKTGTVN